MKIGETNKVSENIVLDNILGIMCFGIFAAGVFYSNTRALPEVPNVALIEQTDHSMEPNLALLKNEDFRNDFSVREFRVVLR